MLMVPRCEAIAPPLQTSIPALLPKQNAIVIFLDELPSLKLDQLRQWINEYHSNRGCFRLGIQSRLLWRGHSRRSAVGLDW